MEESSSTNLNERPASNHDSTTRGRLASIDIGTNSVKLWVADCDKDGFPETVHEEIEITKLGQDRSTDGALTEEAIERTLATTRRFVCIARELNVKDMTIGATSAVRQATNQKEFLKRARNELKQDVQVISGQQEAEYTFSGVSYGRVGEHDAITVFDVGGGSTEIIYGEHTHSVFQKSVPVGSVQLYEQLGWKGTLTPAELKNGIEHTRHMFTEHISSGNLQKCANSSVLIGVGGTVATLVQVYLGLEEFSKTNIEGCRMSRQDLLKTSEDLFRHSPAERVKKLHVKPGRSEYITGGAAVVNGVLETLSVSELEATCRGLRHGLLIDTFLSST